MIDRVLIALLMTDRYNTWKDNLGPGPDKKLAADRIEEPTAKVYQITSKVWYHERTDEWVLKL